MPSITITTEHPGDTKLIELYQIMSDMTQPECSKTCRVPLSCCDAMYCKLTRDWARTKWGVELKPTAGHPTLLFMGPSGCIVPPHMRPLCTVHTCQINSFGCKPEDSDWTKRYFRIRNRIAKLEGEKARGT